MDLFRIASRIADTHRRVSLESILETVQENCPSSLRDIMQNTDGEYKLIDLESAKIVQVK